MTNLMHLRRELPGTYFVTDRSNQEELTRIQIQDQMVTSLMGGVLPEQSDPGSLRRVLDVGCGTGGWLIETAKMYPDIELLIGVDVSDKVLDYARTQARAQKVAQRVEFHMMDALRQLSFPQNHFDLINQRFGSSWLRTWDWTRLFSECLNVARPGAIIRVTEAENVISNSPALQCFSEILLQAFHQSGHSFICQPDGVTRELEALLQRHRLDQVQTRAYKLEYRADLPEWQSFCKDVQYLFRTALPFAQKWLRVPDNYEEICQQALREMQQPDFVASGNMLTVWGRVPLEKECIRLFSEQR